ncbi:hypothetical protein EYF80_056391 [Liparis tanakae]|uniref:Uncharacterized protein n=1 Tax=Liparis tanakae TaxID=230148 RepID=A0A4Z2EX04_9TELE|nr:hypothetical protein EYF80_056391 [Liparis tanakae]
MTTHLPTEAGASAVMMNSVPTCSTGERTTITLTQGGQMSLAAGGGEGPWVSISEVSLELELEGEEKEGVDSHSSFSDSVISPSSGSLFPSESALEAGLFFFFSFLDFDFFFFFLDLSFFSSFFSPSSSSSESVLCLFLLEEVLPLPSLRLEECLRRGAASGLRDFRLDFFFIVFLSTHSGSSSSNSSNMNSCRQTVNREVSASSSPTGRWLWSSHSPEHLVSVFKGNSLQTFLYPSVLDVLGLYMSDGGVFSALQSRSSSFRNSTRSRSSSVHSRRSSSASSGSSSCSCSSGCASSSGSCTSFSQTSFSMSSTKETPTVDSVKNRDAR